MSDAMWITTVYMGSAEDADEDEVRDIATHESWPKARRWMLDRLLPFTDDECDQCRADGVSALVGLATARRLYSWSAEIDGDEYVISYQYELPGWCEPLPEEAEATIMTPIRNAFIQHPDGSVEEIVFPPGESTVTFQARPGRVTFVKPEEAS